jgi:molecular chaperone HtpG
LKAALVCFSASFLEKANLMLDANSILPTSIASLVSQSDEAPSVHESLHRHIQWLTETSGRMPLFPDFTDHGLPHLRAVLELAEFLIADGSLGRPNSFDVFTPADAAVLVHAILLHDAGMHITESEFLSLITNANSPTIEDLDSDAWSEAWEKFIEEAIRWDDRTCLSNFGRLLENRQGERLPIRRPPSNVHAWSEVDRRLAGEFIRRHHARLAHEIAIFGWPDGMNSERRKPAPVEASMAHPKLADLAGLVARSHGSSIRSMQPYLLNHHSLRETRGVHPIYLMALLRVADCLHIHAERAPGGSAQLQRLESPLSQREFAAHHAIYDVRLNTDEDPEAVFIDVNPESLDSVATYLRLQEWIRGLQGELDHSWAVLGEVYGRYGNLSKLWLSLRRAKSNIMLPEFADKVRFIPTRANFEAANGDFLKLLIRPLYGDQPSIGVRELMQNALDAVRERRAISQTNHVEWESISVRFSDSDVIVSLCKRDLMTPAYEEGGPPQHWEQWIEVCDRGIGMTPEIVRDYFLKAGATYRRSNAWLRQFTDGESNSKVLRSGRFGVGALAAFLIGEELQLITRHHSASDGITFCAKLDEELVELRKAAHRVGTTVRVCTDNPDLAGNMEYSEGWDWYHLANPKVTRCVYGRDIDLNINETEEGSISEREYLPSEGAPLPATWRRIAHEQFCDVHWSVLDNDAPLLTCNGIRIIHRYGNDKVRWHTLESNGKSWNSLRSTESPYDCRCQRFLYLIPMEIYPSI